MSNHLTYLCHSNLLSVWNSSDLSDSVLYKIGYICKLMQIWPIFGQWQHILDFHSPKTKLLVPGSFGCITLTCGSSACGWCGRGFTRLSLLTPDPLLFLFDLKDLPVDPCTLCCLLTGYVLSVTPVCSWSDNVPNVLKKTRNKIILFKIFFLLFFP